MDDAPNVTRRKRLLVWAITAVAALGLVVLAGAILLPMFLIMSLSSGIEAAEASKCISRMRVMYHGLVVYKADFGGLPQESGLHFLTAPNPDGEWRSAPDRVDGPDWAFFHRDMQRFPIEEFPGDGSEPLIACNKNTVEHHPDVVHVLYTDGAVHALVLDDLKAQGAVPPDTTELIVGPNSAHEDLRKMRRD